MGQKVSRGGRKGKENVATKQSPFRLFEYICQTCGSKRPIQYFYRNGVFLSQTPRVVCGNCNNSIVADPFKTVDYSCPMCKKWRKVRLPAKPVPLNMYNVSVVSCQCGFRGEVSVGRLMDVSCASCWGNTKELTGTWTENGDEIKSFCHSCQGYQRAFARLPKKATPSNTADMEYTCDNCFRVRPLHAEELLRNQGLAYCSLCGWVGYPEIRERNNPEAAAKPKKRPAKPTVEEAAPPPSKPMLGFGGPGGPRGAGAGFGDSEVTELAVLPA